MADNWDKVEERKQGSDETWDGSDVLIGTLKSVQENVGPNGSMMYNVEKDDGTLVGVWGSSVIDSKLDGVEKGSRVRIEFLGKQDNPRTGRSYKDYSVKAIPPAASEPVNVPLPEAVGGGEGEAIDLSDVPFGDDAEKK